MYEVAGRDRAWTIASRRWQMDSYCCNAAFLSAISEQLVHVHCYTQNIPKSNISKIIDLLFPILCILIGM